MVRAAQLHIKAAAGKVSLPFTQALVLGVLCNWLACLAVCVFFPIWLFVASGFDPTGGFSHSIANMYYIPAGILAKCNTFP